MQLGMTKIEPMKKPVRAKPGPKPKPDAEKVVKKTVSLQPKTYEGLVAIGDGVLSRGIEVMFESAARRSKQRKA